MPNETKPAAGQDRILVDSCDFKWYMRGDVQTLRKTRDCKSKTCPKSKYYEPPQPKN
ncbi:hypothetical protein ACLX1H_001169 [Fusarium chlamydosporum]